VTKRHCYYFAGGGTGGHLTPGLAVAAELLERDHRCRIVFVGSDRPLERRLVSADGYEHRVLPVESTATLRRHPLRFALRNWRAYRMARALLETDSPQVVIGLGGFASVPTLQAAIRKGIPAVLLEQNTIPGRATRFFSRRAAAVCTAFSETAGRLPSGSRVELTGNPVRGAIAELCLREATLGAGAMPTLLVLGGSQGAESLNASVASLLLRQPPQLIGWRIVHQTGAAQHAQIEEAYRKAGFAHFVQPFFENLSDWYSEATLVISRAGATTLAELACAGCPTVLLPFPHAADNHQLANARVFEAAGAAMVIEHSASPSATGGQLAQAVSSLANDPLRRAAMRRAMGTLARPDAARNVWQVLQTLPSRSIT